MFIELLHMKVLRSGGAKSTDRVLIYWHIALRWSAKQSLVAKVYKHLAPLEPEQSFLLLLTDE